MERDTAKVSPFSIASERVASSRAVSHVPALLFSVTVTSDNGGNGTATVYDGSSVEGDQKVDVAVLDGDTKHLEYDPPLRMRRGIYVTVGSHITSVQVRFAMFRE